MMFPLDTGFVAALPYAGFAALSLLCFAVGLKRQRLAFALPIVAGLLWVGVVASQTDMNVQYAGLWPFFLAIGLGVILVASFCWTAAVHLLLKLLQRKTARTPPKVIAGFGFLAPVFVGLAWGLWANVIPNNTCANSHLDVSLDGRGSYRLFPEFVSSLSGAREDGPLGRKIGTYSTKAKHRMELARLCRRNDVLQVKKVVVYGAGEAAGLAETCARGARPFCDKIDFEALAKVHSVVIANYDDDALSLKDIWGKVGGKMSISGGDQSEGYVCEGVGKGKPNCHVWRRVAPFTFARASTWHMAESDTVEEHLKATWAALDGVLAAFQIPD